ncbi:MAG: carboxypeptidase-like regulatory domain-containing protein [Nitrospiria bacterium]
MNKTSKALGLALAMGLVSTPLVFAKYAEGPVSGGGSIKGKVSFKGAQPGPVEFKLAQWPQADFCGKFDAEGGVRKRQDVRVKDGGLGDVVVYIEKIEKGKPFKTIETKIVANGCRFLVAEGEGPSRQVTVVLNAKKTGKKSVIKVKNTDADPSDPKTAEGVLHNPHGYDVKGFITKTTFNKPVPKKGQEITIKVKKTWFKKSESFMKVECDQHNYMNVWAVPVRNPYYAIVNDDGTFEIGDVPAGKYKLKAFHQKLGFKTLDVTVAGGAAADANFEYAAK